METKTFNFNKDKFTKHMIGLPLLIILASICSSLGGLFQNLPFYYTFIIPFLLTFFFLYALFFDKRVVELSFKEDRISYKLSFDKRHYEILYDDVKTCEINFAPIYCFHFKDTDKYKKIRLSYFTKQDEAEINEQMKSVFVVDKRYTVYQKNEN